MMRQERRAGTHSEIPTHVPRCQLASSATASHVLKAVVGDAIRSGECAHDGVVSLAYVRDYAHQAVHEGTCDP